MSVIVAEKKTPHGLLLVLTDDVLLEKCFEEGKLQLDLRGGFCRGIVMKKEEIKQLLHTARHVHATGKEAVAILVEMDLVEGDRVLWVQNIPHAQVFME